MKGKCVPNETVRDHYAHGGSFEDMPGEDLITPEHLLHGLRPAVADIAHDALDQVLTDFRRPEFRAGLGATVLMTALLVRTRLPGIVVIPLSVMVGASVEHLYGMTVDIHQKLTADAAKPV